MRSERSPRRNEEIINKYVKEDHSEKPTFIKNTKMSLEKTKHGTEEKEKPVTIFIKIASQEHTKQWNGNDRTKLMEIVQ